MISLNQSEFMTTYTGKKFHLFDPRVEEVDIRDIAHALGMLCRFTGHCNRFYSVAQHCWHASHLVDPVYALEALLHDAAEAYINDLSRPLKHHPNISGYVETEHQIEQVIAEKFRMVYPMSPVVKDVDNKLVCTEAMQLMTEHEWAEGHPRFNLTLPSWDPKEANYRYLTRFLELQ